MSSVAFAQYEVPNPIYAAPGSYYNSASSTDPATLKAQLNAIIDNHTSYSYSGSAHDAAMLKLDEDPNNSANVLLIYNGVSIAKSLVLNVNYDREHLWCNSYGLDGVNPGFSDLWNLRVCDANVNNDRSNNYYDNGGSSANAEAPDCNEVEGVSWEPRAIEKGDIARSMFYMDTRYEGDGDGDNFANNLTLTDTVSSITTSNANMGKLSTLLKWHYQDGVSNSERRRNHLIYTPDTGPNGWNGTARNQGNRNPFIDHPEWVWAVFGGGNNNSKVYAGNTVNADGSSTTTASLRVMQGGTWGTANVNLNKLGTNPTTYDLTVTGDASTAAAGPGQAFDYNTQVRGLTITMNNATAPTSVLGLKTGTITIDNTDVTTGGVAMGSADANDTINVTGQVVTNRVITTTAGSFGRIVVGANVTTGTTLDSPGSDNTNTRVTVNGTLSSTDSNGVFITTGSARTFNGTVITHSRTLQGNFATPGTKSGARSFSVTGEGLAGESVGGVSVNYTATALDHAQPSLASGTSTPSQTYDFGYVPTGFTPRTTNFTVYNNATASGATLTASMDVDGKTITGSSAMTDNVVASPSGTPLAADAAGWGYTATFTPGIATNDDTSTHTINVSDENIPGGNARPSLSFITQGRTVTNAGVFPATGFIDLFNGETFTTTTGMSIGAGATITKQGAGSMVINGAQTNGANSTLAVSQGSVQLNSDAGSSLAINVAPGALTTFNSPQHLRALSVEGDANVSAGSSKMLVADSFSHAGAGKLDLHDGKMIVRAQDIGSWNGSAYTGLTGLVQSGRNEGTWDGIGILTSQTNATTSVLTGLAIATADDTGYAGDIWNGESLSSGDAVIAYTWGGDANLDGTLNGDDYFRIDSNILQSGVVFGYFNGDFNYDGALNGDDYFIIDSNITFAQNSGGPPQSLAAVPEPATLGALIALPLLARRRRRSR